MLEKYVILEKFRFMYRNNNHASQSIKKEEKE